MLMNLLLNLLILLVLCIHFLNTIIFFLWYCLQYYDCIGCRKSHLSILVYAFIFRHSNVLNHWWFWYFPPGIGIMPPIMVSPITTRQFPQPFLVIFFVDKVTFARIFPLSLSCSVAAGFLFPLERLYVCQTDLSHKDLLA